MSKIIEAIHVNHTYLPGSVYAHQALQEINFSLDRGQVLGIFGPNGSGKSTLAQHCNGLLKPTTGTMLICGIDTAQTRTSSKLWRKAGLVFQYPEQQIFQTAVYDEVAYGPRNLGLPEHEVRTRVSEAMQQVGLNLEKIASLAPMSLSGGQRRRIAIAGMLAIQPELLLLDEPLAGLDADGRKLIINLIKNRRQKGETTVVISHRLKEIITITDQIAILEKGRLAFFGDVGQLLTKPEILARYHYQLPEYLQLVTALAAKGFDINTNIKSMPEAVAEIIRWLAQSKGQAAATKSLPDT